MPDDSKAPLSFADALRGWPEAELRKGADDPQYGPAIRAELDRRARLPVVKLQHLPVARPDGSNQRQLFITINGRQSLHEGPGKGRR